MTLNSNKYYLIIFCVIILILSSCTYKNKENDKYSDSTNIKIHFSQNLEISNPKFISIIDEYINKIEDSDKRKDKKFIYQLFIGKYMPDGSAEIILDLEQSKNGFQSKYPIGYFQHRGRNFLIYSAISDYCVKDSSILSIYDNLDNHLYNDLVTGWDTMKINIPLYGVIWDYPTYSYKLKNDSLTREWVVPPANIKYLK